MKAASDLQIRWFLRLLYRGTWCDLGSDINGENLFHLKHYDGLIVKNLGAGGKFIGRFKDGVHNFLGRSARVLVDDVFHAAAAKLLVFGIAGIDNTVTEEHEYITRLGVDVDFIVGDVFKHAQRQAGDFQHVGVALVTINGAGKPGVGDPHGALVIVPDGAGEHKVLRVKPAMVQ